jgi:hypothetical protein
MREEEIAVNWFSTATIVDDYGDRCSGHWSFLAGEDEMDNDIDGESI